MSLKGWYLFEIEQSEDIWMGSPWGFPDIVGMGDTIAETVEAIRESLVLYFRENNTTKIPENVCIDEPTLIRILIEQQTIEKLCMPIYLDPNEYVVEVDRKKFEDIKKLFPVEKRIAV